MSEIGIWKIGDRIKVSPLTYFLEVLVFKSKVERLFENVTEEENGWKDKIKIRNDLRTIYNQTFSKKISDAKLDDFIYKIERDNSLDDEDF